MASLETIQIVTNETLARVKEVQASLVSMSKQLDPIYDAVIKTDCHGATDTANAAVATLRVGLDTAFVFGTLR